MTLVAYSLAVLRLWAFGDMCITGPAGTPCFLVAESAVIRAMCPEGAGLSELWIAQERMMRERCDRVDSTPAQNADFEALYWDLNRDGAFTLPDAQRALFVYLTAAGCPSTGCVEDVDGDGIVTLLDAQRVLFRYFTGLNCPDTGRLCFSPGRLQ